MRRYQNPDVFEPLAMAYALGTLRGRARQRFEKLMARHFYLRVVTQAYQQQFAGLVDLLPSEAPPPQVWQRLERELALPAAGQSAVKQEGQTGRSWRNWLQWPAMALASMLAAVLTVWMLQYPSPKVYFADLTSSSQASVALASVSKSDMSINIALAQAMPMKEGVMPTLWCLSKKPGEMPMRMGPLKPEGYSRLEIDMPTWKGLKGVSQLAISLEPMDHPDAQQPMGEVIYVGELMRGE
ncbi:MAG: anti-sigma factor [Thiolinea sp.]